MCLQSSFSLYLCTDQLR
uniref:Uncharacterized protein n=1 Tax=Anguilla anguilla TaxID=7936 RepID=A0A0E9RK62_ANGAN